MNIFWNHAEGRLRAAWRLLLQPLLMMILGAIPILIIAEPLTALHRRGLFLPAQGHEAYDRIINMIIGPFLTAAVVASVILAARWLDHRDLGDFGVRLDGWWWRSLALGLAVGTTVMAAVFTFELCLGWVQVTDVLAANVNGLALGLALAFSAVKVLCVGTYEEIVSRGYLLRNLAEGTSLPVAVVLSSAVFALLHLTNDNAGVLSTIGLFVNGLLFAVALLATGRLSASIGVHIAWNLFEGAVFGFPVTGDKEGASLLGIEQRGADVMTGGAFGPEGGLVGIAASLLGIAIFLLVRSAKLQQRQQERDDE